MLHLLKSLVFTKTGVTWWWFFFFFLKSCCVCFLKNSKQNFNLHVYWRGNTEKLLFYSSLLARVSLFSVSSARSLTMRTEEHSLPVFPRRKCLQHHSTFCFSMYEHMQVCGPLANPLPLAVEHLDQF